MGKTFKKYKGKKYQDREARNRKASRGCLNNKGCDYCLSSKVHKHRKQMIDYDQREETEE